MLNKNHFNKIYLNCRRGILELDIILINFLEKKYFKLKRKNLKDFEKLLNNSDQNLYSWIIKKVRCDKKELVEIINIIKYSIKNIKFN